MTDSRKSVNYRTFWACDFRVKMLYLEYQVLQKRGSDMFIVLAGGLLVIIFAVIVAVVSSVSAAVAAETDSED